METPAHSSMGSGGVAPSDSRRGSARVSAPAPLAGRARGLYNARAPQPHPTFAMAVERTLSIIKPDATRRDLTGQINDRFERAGLRIVAQRRFRLDRAQAEAFYAVHRERPFYQSLCEYMTSGPIVVQVLEGEGAIARHREIMGATDPAQAAAGTIRRDFGESVEANATHGSDAPESAAWEIAFFFSAIDIVG